MKHVYIYIITLLTGSFGYSQQILKRVTETDTQVIVELFNFRNGTIPTQITGPENFISENSSVYFQYYADVDGVTTLLGHNPDNVYEPVEIEEPLYLLDIPFSLVNATKRRRESWGEGFTEYNGEIPVSYVTVLAINTLGIQAIGSGPGDNGGDLNYSKFFVNKKLINGDPVPAAHAWHSIQVPLISGPALRMPSSVPIISWPTVHRG